ncbi:MAG: hypothetical protein N2C12_19000, partial [Planctomycetales bacterium]
MIENHRQAAGAGREWCGSAHVASGPAFDTDANYLFCSYFLLSKTLIQSSYRHVNRGARGARSRGNHNG